MTKIVIARGDGIGSEIMNATLRILDAAKASIQIEEIEIGEKMYLQGHTSGISDDSWDKIHKNKIILKAPITTPLGSGYKSLNVTFRKALSLYANIRPVVSYEPYIIGLHNDIDVTIVRENEEDLYAGIEFRLDQNAFVALKLLTQPGTEKIIRKAFEYACINGRKKVTCVTKNNIMKITDGMFARVFKSIAEEYPKIESNHMIVDIATARLASRPEMFDVIVTLNLYGDIMSDVIADISGSVGLAGSSNIGEDYAMFEAIHGSAPDIAGKNIANPSGLIQASVMMLKHIGQHVQAAVVEQSLLQTIQDGVHTADIYHKGESKQKASTTEFADAVIANIIKIQNSGAMQKIEALYQNIEKDCKLDANNNLNSRSIHDAKNIEQKIIGADLFISNIDAQLERLECDFNHFAEILQKDVNAVGMRIKVISSRGIQMWPIAIVQKFSTNFLRFRFIIDANYKNNKEAQVIIANLQHKIIEHNLNIAAMATLNEFSDEDYMGQGYSLAQGE